MLKSKVSDWLVYINLLSWKTKEGKLCPPKQMSWTKTQRHPGTRPPKDFPVPWDPCLEQRKTFPCQKRHTRNRSQRFTEWSDEEIDHPGTPSTVLPQGNLDLHLHRWLSRGRNMQWWSGCMCKVPRWHRRQTQLCNWSVLHKLQSRDRGSKSSGSPYWE